MNIHRTRVVASVAVAALGLCLTSHSGAAASNIVQAPRDSFLVAVRGASVADILRAAHGAKGVADLSVIARAGQPAVLAAERAARASLRPVESAATALGASVVGRYVASANGLLVHATADQIGALARRPDVIAVERAPRVRPDLSHSVPWIGARKVAQDLGFDGSGTVIAVVDTGIDYTHADLGGTGTVEAYQAATTDPVGIQDSFGGAPLFPNAKVVGGWDFVGQRYNPPWLCPPAEEAAGTCTTVPEPDSDPLDQWGHGTHVAGITAGTGTQSGTVSAGVAPGASLVGLKVYSHQSNVDEEVDVLLDALEWCTRVNLGLDVPGTPPPGGHVDVINMSLGEPYGQGSNLFDQAVAAATDAGITVVVSAGNENDRPFIVGAPSSSPKVLSVASATAPSDSYQVEFSWNGGSSTALGSEGNATVSLEVTGRVEDPLASMGLACNGGDWSTDPPAGKIALVERGQCTLGEKVLNAQGAGATGIVMYSDGRPRIGLSGGVDEPQIPGLMIDHDPGAEIAGLMAEGTVVTVAMDPESKAEDTMRADAISNFSSRGPSKHGALKPDITAPGSSIASAGVGRGDGSSTLSGTSMSAPHASGSAALIRHRSNAESLGLTGTDVAALLMNTALPSVTDTGVGGVVRSVTRQGAGRVDLVHAASTGLLVRAGPLASLYSGPMAIQGVRTETFDVTIRNLDHELARLGAFPTFRNPAGQEALTFRVRSPIIIPPGATLPISIEVDIEAAQLPDWPYGLSGISAQSADGVEMDGWLELAAVDVSGNPIPDGDAAGLPFTFIARRASVVDSPGLPPLDWRPEPPATHELSFNNDSAFPGVAELYWQAGEDPDEPDVLAELDIRHVGARFVGPHVDVTTTVLGFAISTWEPMPTPFSTRMSVFVDTDADGRPDHRLRLAPLSDLGGNDQSAFGVGVAGWDPDTGTAGSEVLAARAPSDVNTHAVMFEIPIQALGMSQIAPIAFSVRHEALSEPEHNANEDWLGSATADRAPDGEAMYQLDQDSKSYWLSQWTVDVPGRSTQMVGIDPNDVPEASALLAVFPQNDPSDSDAQVRVLANDVIPRDESSTLYLPATYKNFELYPPGPDDVVRAGIDALEATPKFRMTFDDFIAANPEGSWLREHEFDKDAGVDVVSRPKVGIDHMWQIRFRDKGYVHVEGITWRCGPIDWYMFTRPELIARLRNIFPARGWDPDGRARSDLSLLQFRKYDGPSRTTYLAQVPESGGPIVLMSKTVGDLTGPELSQVYRFREFNAGDILVGAPRGVACDIRERRNQR